MAGARAVSRAVEKNRGLTPHRRKDIKNPRVKNKKRYEARRALFSACLSLQQACIRLGCLIL